VGGPPWRSKVRDRSKDGDRSIDLANALPTAGGSQLRPERIDGLLSITFAILVLRWKALVDFSAYGSVGSCSSEGQVTEATSL